MEYSGAASFYFLSIFFLLFQVLFFGIRWNEAQSTSKTFFFFIFGYFSIFFYFGVRVLFFFVGRVLVCLRRLGYYRVLPSFTEFFFGPPHPSRSCGSFTEFFFKFLPSFFFFFFKPTPTAVKKKQHTGRYRVLPSFFFCRTNPMGLNGNRIRKPLPSFYRVFFFLLGFRLNRRPTDEGHAPLASGEIRRRRPFLLSNNTNRPNKMETPERERERMKRRGKE